MKSFSQTLSVFIVGVLAASAAQAGTVLRLKAGTIQVKDESSRIAALAVQGNAATVKHVVVQFGRKIKEADRKALQKLGLEIKSYLPDDALVVKGDVAVTSKLVGSVDGVRAVVDFAPAWRLGKEFNGLTGTASKLIIVRTFDAKSTAEIAADIKSKGFTVKSASGRMIMIEAVPAKAGPAISQIDGVEFVQAMPKIVTSMLPVETENSMADAPLTGFESGTKIMGFSEAWARGYNGAGQVVAMADTGTDVGVVGMLSADLNPAVSKGYPMGLANFTWADGMGHGTHVSGSIAGRGTSSGGVLKGGAHGAKFVPEGMFNPLLKRLLVETDFEKLMGTPLKNDGAHIHSNSWGAAQNFGAYDALAASADEVMWSNPTLLVLFAAGNSGDDANGDGKIDENSIGTPGTAKNVLTVGASENTVSVGGIQKQLKDLGLLQPDGSRKYPFKNEPLGSDTLSNNENGIACFSSRGPTSDGRIKPEIVAPGTNILSTRSHQKGAEDLWGKYNDDYVWAGGTSMATPLTAGAATVTRQFLVKARGIAEPSGAVVKATLMHTAKDLFPGQYGTGAGQELPTRRPNVHEGYGRVDVDYSTRLGSETQIIDSTAGVAAGAEASYKVNVASGEGLRVTLTWTDAPAAANASKTLVNDLDLVVTGPGGTFTKNDHTNNTEMVEVESPAAGQYTVTVKGTNVPSGKDGKQPYALLISHGGSSAFRRH